MKMKILKISLSVFFISALLLSAIYVSDREKRFEYSEKSTVAMGTVLTQKIYSSEGAQCVSDIINVVNSLENIISWRKEDSHIAQLNKNGSIENAALASVFKECIRISQASEGAFDITVGELSRLWSIGEQGERVPGKKEIERVLKNIGYENIKIEGNKITLTSDCLIDLGAVGKGLACDMVKSYLLSCDDIDGAVVSVGGSNVVFGRYNKAGDKWKIAVRHPRSENEFLGIISLDEGFVSTSGDYEKYIIEDGVRYHHISDANTGYPAQSGLISVTVVCDSGLLSDALSTACFVLGREKGGALIEKYGAAGIFVDEQLNISTVGDIDFEAY